MAEKVTLMILKVDLQCPCSYKKVKKILCKFPQIRDQEYDEKQNLVKITVVCCNPEKIRDKLCCKAGGKVITSVEIVEKLPPKPEKPNESKPEEPRKHKEPVPAQPCPHPPVPVVYCCVTCSGGHGWGSCHCGCRRPVPSPPCYDNCGYGYGSYGKGCYVSLCDYFSEENTGSCTIM